MGAVVICAALILGIPAAANAATLVTVDSAIGVIDMSGVNNDMTVSYPAPFTVSVTDPSGLQAGDSSDSTTCTLISPEQVTCESFSPDGIEPARDPVVNVSLGGGNDSFQALGTNPARLGIQGGQGDDLDQRR